MASILIRAVIIYVFLLIGLRVMGKRQIGELDVGDLVSTLLISELASIPIDDPDIPLLNAIIPIIFIVCAEILLSALKNRSERLKSIFDGEPSFIIYKGRLLQKALSENRISVNELLSAMRCAGIGDIGEIEYCLVEQNGTLSVMKRGEGGFAHPIVIDGEIKDEAMMRAGYSEADLRADAKGMSLGEIFLMTVDDGGKVNIIKKEGRYKT